MLLQNVVFVLRGGMNANLRGRKGERAGGEGDEGQAPAGVHPPGMCSRGELLRVGASDETL